MYPISLPYPRIASSTLTSSNIKVQRFDYGQKLIRKPLEPEYVTLSIVYTTIEMKLFVNWFDTELDQGRIEFLADWKFKPSNTSYRFVSNYNWKKLSSDLFEINAKLLVNN